MALYDSILADPIGNCIECGTSFERGLQGSPRQVCSNRCYTRIWRRKNPERAREQAIARYPYNKQYRKDVRAGKRIVKHRDIPIWEACLGY